MKKFILTAFAVLVGLVVLDYANGPIFPDEVYCDLGAGNSWHIPASTAATSWSANDGCSAYKPECATRWTYTEASNTCGHTTILDGWRQKKPLLDRSMASFGLSVIDPMTSQPSVSYEAVRVAADQRAKQEAAKAAKEAMEAAARQAVLNDRMARLNAAEAAKRAVEEAEQEAQRGRYAAKAAEEQARLQYLRSHCRNGVC